MRALLPKIGLALVVGLAGGALAHAVNMPLAWMLGPMLATFAASLMRAPIAMPMKIRQPVLVVMGVFLGSSFTPDIIDQVGQWPWSIATMLLYVPVITGLTMFYYMRVAGLDLSTAVFASTPGGLTITVLVGSESGGNEQQIALLQGLRVMLVVLAAPLIVTYLTGVVPPTGIGESTRAIVSLREAGLLIVCAAVGILIARFIHFPSPNMTGAMFSSALLYVTGSVTGVLPHWFVDVALLVLGTSIGSRFITVDAKMLARLAGHGVVSVCIAVVASGIMAWILSHALGLEFVSVMLAFAPGGVAEMSLIAIAMNIDPGFVALHHLSRIFEILLVMPLVGKYLRSKNAG
jgi:hypothetical protein